VRRALAAAAALALLALVGLALGLAAAHREIDSLAPPLPDGADLLWAVPSPELPVRLRWLDTARQAMPRAAVLEPELDPDPQAPWAMSHPAFAIEWADGRLLLVDLGMGRAAARAFGRPLEWLAGADPIEPRGSAAEQLGPAVGRVAGVAFTHLHTDHTSGAAELCAARRGARLPLLQGRLQAERANYTTRAGRADLASAGCLEPRVLDGDPPLAAEGFPGVLVVPVAGHTPDSQVFVVHLRSAEGVRSWVLVGDVVNHADALRHDLPKPALYSLLVVPESTRRLAALRAYLGQLGRRHRAGLLPSHDALALEASGLEPFAP
jgi:glyoxylase-like metal-dependent hydrolase (beta-lactamase superfamily II)